MLLFVLAPGLFLRLGMRIFPKDHKRRWEFLSELGHVPRRKRPGWVTGNLIRCFAEGPPARIQARQAKKVRVIDGYTPSMRPEWEQDQAIREWMRKQGMNIANHDAIPKDVLDVYFDSNGTEHE